MVELFYDLPFKKVGWACIQFLWLSTLYLGAVALVLKILQQFRPKIKYNIGLGALIILPVIPVLLFVTHKGILTPIGLADWGLPEAVQGSQEPIIEGLPQVTAIELGSFAPNLYFWVGVLWIVAVFLFAGYYLLSAVILHFKLRKKHLLNDAKISRNLEELANDLDISSSFKIVKASFKEGPAVAGVFRPYILIPESLSDKYSDDEVRAVLLHELVHIKRKDYFFALLQRFIKVIFIFQPLVWWLNGKVKREREHVCDEAVINITQDSYLYGNALVKLQLENQYPAAHTLNISGNSTVDRIKLLLENKRSSMSLLKKCSRSFIALLIIGLSLFSTLWSSYHLHPVNKGQFELAEVNQAWNTDYELVTDLQIE